MVFFITLCRCTNYTVQRCCFHIRFVNTVLTKLKLIASRLSPNILVSNDADCVVPVTNNGQHIRQSSLMDV